MEPLLVAQGLTKKYPGTTALKAIDLQLEKGHIVGLVGPNGSGKSTFLRLAAAQTTPSKGELYIDGLRPGFETKGIVSYLPDSNHLYDWMKVGEIVAFFNTFFPGFSSNKAEKMLEFMKIPLNKEIRTLSKGMGVRLRLSLALSWEAKLVLLDEPLSGIDPASRDKIIDVILKEQESMDTTIVVATHLVGEVEPLLSYVVFLSEGRIALEGETDRLRADYGCSIDKIVRRELV